MTDKVPDEALPAIPELSNDFAEITKRLKKEPQSVQQIIALSACGFSRRAVARAFGIDPATVQYHIDKHDPNRVLVPTQEARRHLLGTLLESKVGDCLLMLTPEKIGKLNALELVDDSPGDLGRNLMDCGKV